MNDGDDVIVTGTVSEGSPSADPNQPPVTEIVTPSISVQTTGQPLPALTMLTSADLSSTDGPLQLEKYEGMRVATGVLTVVAPTSGTVNEANAVPATAFDGAAVTYSLPIATDNLDSSVPVVCAPASGTFFAVGATTVSCSATDLAGNSGHTSSSSPSRSAMLPARCLASDRSTAPIA